MSKGKHHNGGWHKNEDGEWCKKENSNDSDHEHDSKPQKETTTTTSIAEDVETSIPNKNSETTTTSTTNANSVTNGPNGSAPNASTSTSIQEPTTTTISTTPTTVHDDAELIPPITIHNTSTTVEQVVAPETLPFTGPADDPTTGVILGFSLIAAGWLLKRQRKVV